MTPSGVLMDLKYPKFFRDLLVHWHGETLIEDVDVGKRTKVLEALVTVFDPENPRGAQPLAPGPSSPLCFKCKLYETGCQNPFMPPTGSDAPLVTIVYDSVTKKEDAKGQVGADGFPGWIAKIIHDNREQTGVSLDDIRWFPLTRCANYGSAKVNYKIKGNWCRYHLVDDLMRHPPKLLIPVGTASLGMLCHKSSAQDWQGKQLTYRGWPDDWLKNRAYMLPVPNPARPEETMVGHPIFGTVPTTRIPMVPIQSPHIVLSSLNQVVVARWKKTVISAVKLAKRGVTAKTYTRPWYRFTKDPVLAAAGLSEIIGNPGLWVCYDTETTGLKPWPFHTLCTTRLATPPAIVSMMFRWRDPKTNAPRSIGFPWDYEGSAMRPHMAKLAPIIYKALTKSKLIGHNLTFDVLYTFATLYRRWLVGWDDPEFNRRRDRWICALADAAKFDTWHAAYTYMQKAGSLGLEVVTYDWAPELAGYEEDMTLLIDLHREDMHPGEGKGGHYLNCAESYWPTHVIPYVMGDVESCYIIHERLKVKLQETEDKRYEIPLARPGAPGRFRFFKPQSRDWVYNRIMVPAASVLMKLMGRGMFVSLKELERLEKILPTTIEAFRATFKKIDPNIVRWCKEQEDTLPGWELDLENKAQLKALLFTELDLPVQRLTKTGRKIYGEDEVQWDSQIRAAVLKRDRSLSGIALESRVREEKLVYAATDKFTLNRMAVDHASVRPLQDYRKVYKLYSTYIRPLRNITTVGIDKRARIKEPHLCLDSCIHASFMMTGTRGGRTSCRDPNLQQLPRDGEVKSLYVSRFGERGCMYQGDLSQIELRLMAAACGDPTMIKAYFDGIDLHTLTTSRIFNTPYEHFSKDHMKWLQDKGRDKEAKDLSQRRNIGKCVDLSTLVSVNGRIVRIGSLHAGREVDTFYDITGKTIQVPGGSSAISSFYSNGTAPRILVCAARGLVVCSQTHRFELEDSRLVMAKDLKKGDVLKGVETLDCSAEQSTSLFFNPFSGSRVGPEFQINVTADLVYCLGLFYGDGAANVNRVAITTGGKTPYFEWQDAVAASLRKAGFEPEIERTIDSNVHINSKGESVEWAYGQVVFGSRRVIDVLRQLGAVTVRDEKCQRTLEIPEWLFNASFEIKLQFLAGLLDADGSVSERGDISVCTKCWSFAQDIMVLLRTLGVTCSLCPGWNKTYRRYYYEVNIAKKSNKLFKHILRHHEKADRITLPVFEYRAETPNVVKLVWALEAGPLVDVSVDEPNKYLANGLSCHNTVNFLTGYGGGAFGLQNVLAAKSIYIGIEECESIIASFFDSYPALQRWLMHYKHFIQESHVAVSLFGRVRVFEEVLGEDQEARAKALRAGCNHVIQSTASDMMLLALVAIEQMMREANLESILVSTVHDSLLIDCIQIELPVVHEIVTTVLNNFEAVLPCLLGDDFDTSWLLVPFAGDCEVGMDYLSSRAIPKKDIDWDKILHSKHE